MEMVGTLMGATVHGLIVSGAHGPHTCEDVALPSQAAISPKAVSAACSQSCFLPTPQHLLFRVFLELLAKNLTPTPKSWPILHQTCLLEARQKATDRPVVWGEDRVGLGEDSRRLWCSLSPYPQGEKEKGGGETKERPPPSLSPQSRCITLVTFLFLKPRTGRHHPPAPWESAIPCSPPTPSDHLNFPHLLGIC